MLRQVLSPGNIRSPKKTRRAKPGNKTSRILTPLTPGGTHFLALTIPDLLQIPSASCEVVVKELARVYLLHPKAENFEVAKGTTPHVLAAELFKRISKLIPDCYSIGISKSESGEISIVLYTELEGAEFTMLEAEYINKIKKSNLPLYKYLCHTIGHLLQGGLSDSIAFTYFDKAEELSNAEGDIDEENEAELAELRASVTEKAKAFREVKQKLKAFKKDCRKYRKINVRVPGATTPNETKLISIATAILNSVSVIGDFMEPICQEQQNDLLPCDNYIFLGWQYDSVLDAIHIENVNSSAREGVYSPSHIIRMESSNENPWEFKDVDYALPGYLSTLNSLLQKL